MTENKVASLKIERLALDKLQAHEKNPRRHPPKGSQEWEALRKSLNNDYFDPVVFNVRNSKLVSGHFRVKVMRDEGYTHADCVVVDYDEATHLARMIAANNHSGVADQSLLQEIVGQLSVTDSMVDLTGFTADSVIAMMRPADPEPPLNNAAKETLAQKFGLTPLSVLDARQHYWKKRREAWDGILGLESDIDPVLVEAIYRWYCPAGARVIDLRGNDPLRGLVAGHIGTEYVGITDEGNAAANTALMQTKTEIIEKTPRWEKVNEEPGAFDLAIYEAPQFRSLKEMMEAFEKVFAKASGHLKPNRFFIMFPGRQAKTLGKGYDAEGVAAHLANDAAEKEFSLHGESILLRPLGGTPMACRAFPATRRLARCHSTMLVFFNGKPEEIEREFPFPSMGELTE